MFSPRASVTTGFGMAARADMSDSDGEQTVAQARRFACRENDAGIRKHQAQCAHELHKLAVRDLCERLEFACVGAKPRERNRDLRLPAGAEQIIAMQRETDRFEPPIGQAVKGSDSQSSESRGIRA